MIVLQSLASDFQPGELELALGWGEHGTRPCSRAVAKNPIGVQSLSPALARQRLRWVKAKKNTQRNSAVMRSMNLKLARTLPFAFPKMKDRQQFFKYGSDSITPYRRFN
jgi:hypothetical protein